MPQHFSGKPSRALLQGEFLSGLLEYLPESSGRSYPNKPRVFARKHPLAVILTADCDLDLDFKWRRGQPLTIDKELGHVLLADVNDEAFFYAKWGATPDTRNRLAAMAKQQEERYHRLPSSPPTLGTYAEAKLFVDFKSTFSLPTGEVYYQVRRRFAQRMEHLIPPHVHYLTQRGFFFIGRIGVEI